MLLNEGERIWISAEETTNEKTEIDRSIRIKVHDIFVCDIFNFLLLDFRTYPLYFLRLQEKK